MQPRIETLAQKKLIGKKLIMSIANNATFKLWQAFMPVRKEIKNKLSNDLFSIQVYPPTFNFKNFDITIEFTKWAAIEVSDFNEVSDNMESFILPGGLYAVFDYKGLSTNAKIFEYIFSTWIPNSNYVVDNRPHFELLGEKYKNNDPSSEEEIWIPIKTKA
ncbi:MAG: GyrI-like domain-containing protein [Bacteroidetes bacterium]|nr:GyrI-like domain-containing protein [Bacteroidota bacterium]